MRRFGIVLLMGALLVGISACEPVPPQSSSIPLGQKEFGASVSPWDVGTWASDVGAKPTSVLLFEQWANDRPLDSEFAEARAQGLHSVMVTWEPWQEVPVSEGQAAQYAVQPAYSNAAIAAGKQDAYIKMFADSVKRAGLTVYIRYAHEMNGDWYPWSHDPADYVKAWQRIVFIFRAEGADNAKFVFSMNPNLYESDADFILGVAPYWPGANFVDQIGATMINFGGTKNYSVSQFVERFKIMRDLFPMPLYIAEAQTDEATRVPWLTDLHNWLISPDASWVSGVNLSQQSSRIQSQNGSEVGNLDWNVEDDPATQPIIRAIIRDIT